MGGVTENGVGIVLRKGVMGVLENVRLVQAFLERIEGERFWVWRSGVRSR